MAVKTCAAIVYVSGKTFQAVDRKKAEGIRPYDFCNFGNSIMTGNQIFTGINICSIKAGE